MIVYTCTVVYSSHEDVRMSFMSEKTRVPSACSHKINSNMTTIYKILAPAVSYSQLSILSPYKNKNSHLT